MKELAKWIAFTLALVLVIIFIGRWLHESKAEHELRLYSEAAKVCGEHNVKMVGFTDGSNKFECEDYHRAYEGR